uniref:Leucine-rich repeat-containing protein 51 n=1 Tax=Phasianus colchicus TaxID=9054 RepID=A0A669QHL6_PHACC
MPAHLLPPELIPPLDFSFFPLRSLQDLTPTGSPSPTLALRLPYTGLSSLGGLHPTLQQLLANPTQLRWLDLSFNCLTTIDPVLTTLGGLQSIYLHGNTISCLSEVDKLGALNQLHRLTLYGNPMEEERGYREEPTTEQAARAVPTPEGLHGRFGEDGGQHGLLVGPHRPHLVGGLSLGAVAAAHDAPPPPLRGPAGAAPPLSREGGATTTPLSPPLPLPVSSFVTWRGRANRKRTPPSTSSSSPSRHVRGNQSASSSRLRLPVGVRE